jgi:hypothetical protein
MSKKLFTKGKIKPGIIRNAATNECEKLEIYIKEYKYNYSKTTAEEIKEFKNMPSITDTIKKAALMTIGKGKRHPHHCLKSKNTLETAKDILLNNQTKISRANNFHDLHEIIIKTLKGLKDVGPLYYYDTALLIGAHLGKLPEKIYLHAGTKKGAKNIGINVRGKKYIITQDLPCHKVFENFKLRYCEIEDFLCIYKEELDNIFLKQTQASPQIKC